MAIDQSAIEDIEILLENSYVEKTIDFSVNGILTSYSDPIGGIHPNPENIKLIHDQAISISKIFYQKNKDTQLKIIKLLLDNLKVRDEISRTVVFSIFQIGSLDALMDNIQTAFDDIYDSGLSEMMISLNHLIYAFWSSLTRAQVKAIRAWSKSLDSGDGELAVSLQSNSNTATASHLIWIASQIYAQTNKILVQDVKKRIELGYNPEINEDEIKIKDEFTKFGFPVDLSQALDKVDQKFSSSKDAFDFKGTMDLLRSFTERLYRSILDQYGEDGKKIKEQNSEAVSTFFINKGLVNEHFGKMISLQRHFISDLASHRLKSREEDARLSKNMVIEMSLYIMRRLQNH